MTNEPTLERLIAEIQEQPDVVSRLLREQAEPVQRLAAEIERRDPDALVLVARGSSDNAAVYGRYLFEVCNHRLTSLAAPSGLTLYGSGPRLDQTLVIGISQSGQGEDVVAYVQAARAQGAPTVALVNAEDSPLAAAADWVLPCLAGPELSVPATKTVTAQMTLLAMLSSALGDRFSPASSLQGLPGSIVCALEQRPQAARLAAELARTSLECVIGRGFAFPVALELALKLKETSYVRAEPFSAADFLHGPLALVDASYRALLIDVGGHSSDAARETARTVRERGGDAVFLRAATGGPIDEPGIGVDVPLAEPHAPIVALVLGQLLAVELALARGIDPARPRGLRKVTSTR